MAWYPVKWSLTLGGEDVTEDQLRNELSQKEKEIRRLQKVEERLMKDVKELEEWNKVFEDKIEQLEDDSIRWKERDRMASEIIRALYLQNGPLPRRVHDLVTDWMQAGMSLSQ